MPELLHTQIEKIRNSIDGLESQRAFLGDDIVNPALETLRQQLTVLEDQAAKQVTPAEERRMVTILFMDMVGSTSMAGKLDPEEWRQIVSILHNTLGAAITAHHGIIAQYLGDGLLAFFGARESSENDPENAIRAALDGQAAVNEQFTVEKVQVRAGIHTGLVVVGDLGEASHTEFTASGDAVNLAARLQTTAPPGGILISHDTYRYVRGVFDLTPRPPLTVKGKSEPLQTFLVRRAKPRPFRSVARGVAGVETRTIGREEEFQTLQKAYLRALEGRDMVWTQLLGEPGVGKSRLMADLSDWMDLREETYWLLRARAFQDDINQPFALVRRLWFDRFQISFDAPLEQAEARWVERFKALLGQEDCEEAAHVLGLLVGLPFENSPFVKGMRNDPMQIKGRAMVVSRELVNALRQQNLTVLLLEDLQWTDSASWEYLMEVFLAEAEEERHNGFFILGAARPEWHPPKELEELLRSNLPEENKRQSWGIQISLSPLSDHASRELARELLQRAGDVPEQVIELLVERSEGIPYYTEEMINWFIDHGILDTSGEQWHFLSERLKEEPLPATLQHLLLTRLSSLSQTERDALQRGAIFGRRFWTGGVEALGSSTGAAVLDHLKPRGFVEIQPESAFEGDTEWSFRQNLLQEVTYESVLKRERAKLHGVAASWLEAQARLAGRLDEFAGLLGEHYERAGNLNAAVDWYLQAGGRAMHQGAPQEAAGFYTRALDLLPPVDRERRWQALLGREEAFSVLGEAELRKADITALVELAHAFQDENYLADALFRQALFGLHTGNRSIIDSTSGELLAVARRCGNEIIEAKALAIVAVEKINQGDKSASLQNIEAALKLARRLGNENVLGFILGRAVFCYGDIPDFTRTYALQIEDMELEHRLGNRSEEAGELGNLGSGMVGLGMYKQARSLLEQSRMINEALGAHRMLAYNLDNLGCIYLDMGDLHKARQLLERALHEITPTQDARGKSFILEDLGLVALDMGDAAGAARRFNESLELSSKMEMAGMVCETTIFLADCSLQLGQLDEASKLNHKAWEHLKEHGIVGMNHPGRAYLTCAEIFDALGEAENVCAVLDTGYQELMKVADTINDPEMRSSFLENVPAHRELIEKWERSKL